MTEQTIVLLVAVVLFAAFAAFMAHVSAVAFRSLRGIADKQSDQLMAFHNAGQSLAAHQLELARVALGEKQAEAQLARAKADEARVQADLAERANGRVETSSRFVGTPRRAPVHEEV